MPSDKKANVKPQAKSKAKKGPDKSSASKGGAKAGGKGKAKAKGGAKATGGGKGGITGKHLIIGGTVIILLAAIGVLVFVVTGRKMSETCQAIRKAKDEGKDYSEEFDVVEVNQCERDFGCSFDILKCQIPCPLGFMMDEYRCVISCECASTSRGTFQGDIQFDDVEVNGILVRYGLASKQDIFEVFSSSVRESVLLWPKGPDGRVKIPYEFSSELEEEFPFFEVVFAQYAKQTCVDFVKRRNENDYLSISDEVGCWSHIGRKEGKQILSLGKNCINAGIMYHELLHVLGFEHEHVRPDRDGFIVINKRAIQFGAEGNLAKIREPVKKLGLPYDYRSVTHINSKAWSRPPFEYSFAKPDGSLIRGQPVHLSHVDIEEINILYKCNGEDDDPHGISTIDLVEGANLEGGSQTPGGPTQPNENGPPYGPGSDGAQVSPGTGTGGATFVSGLGPSSGTDQTGSAGGITVSTGPITGITGGIPGSTGGIPGSTGGMTGTTGGIPGSSGGIPGSSGGIPGSSGGITGSSGGIPGSSGGITGTTGGIPGSSDGIPGSSGGIPGSSGGITGTTGGIPGSSDGIPGSSGGTTGTTGGIPGSSDGIPGSSGGMPGTTDGIPGSSGGMPGTTDGVTGSTGGIPGTADGIPGSSGGIPGTTDGVTGSTGGVPGTTDGIPGSSGGTPGTTDGVTGSTGGMPGSTDPNLGPLQLAGIEYQPWTTWSNCLSTCGRGYSIRTRLCLDKDGFISKRCNGPDAEYKICVEEGCPLKTGEWEEWEEWQTCSRTCGVGFHWRYRKCTYGDTYCNGFGVERKNCQEAPCAGERKAPRKTPARARISRFLRP